MITFMHIALSIASLFLILGTLMNLSKNPHWFVRSWDFPRVFIAIISGILAGVYSWFFHDSVWDLLILLGLAGVVVRQVYMIFPYTRFARRTVLETERPPGDERLRLLMSNVLMDNHNYDKWLKVARAAKADIIVAVEVDQGWIDAIASLQDDYPHAVHYPLDNFYGIVLYSRLEFDGEPELKFLVQDDIPSIHATIILKNGQRIRLHALHPRPPEPIYNQDSTPRDAELVIMGQEIEKLERNVPTIVCGDLNDVAWSYTTQLFLRLSKLLDPRMGRGMYNSFNANSRIFRYPLDHVFHSNEFKLVDLHVLEHVGSDHFPVLIELSCEPEAALEQEETQGQDGDHEAAEEFLEEEAEREMDGREDGHVAQNSEYGQGNGAA